MPRNLGKELKIFRIMLVSTFWIPHHLGCEVPCRCEQHHEWPSRQISPSRLSDFLTLWLVLTFSDFLTLWVYDFFWLSDFMTFSEFMTLWLFLTFWLSDFLTFDSRNESDFLLHAQNIQLFFLLLALPRSSCYFVILKFNPWFPRKNRSLIRHFTFILKIWVHY